ncbi:hypothetical protein BC830DRAFT_43678 [Chytriomyces sp. MP71]|nr:hypothetical protein BC830DRAFT_43678 [Chytriomyces sp. MP71]
MDTKSKRGRPPNQRKTTLEDQVRAENQSTGCLTGCSVSQDRFCADRIRTCHSCNRHASARGCLPLCHTQLYIQAHLPGRRRRAIHFAGLVAEYHGSIDGTQSGEHILQLVRQCLQGTIARSHLHWSGIPETRAAECRFVAEQSKSGESGPENKSRAAGSRTFTL